jgi:hypothetical protein
MKTPEKYSTPALNEGDVMMSLLSNPGPVPVIASMIERGKMMEWLLQRFQEIQ